MFKTLVGVIFSCGCMRDSLGGNVNISVEWGAGIAEYHLAC